MATMRGPIVTPIVNTALAVLTLGGLLSGCGGGSADSGGLVSVTPGSDPADLTIAYDDGQGVTATWHLTCEPARGDHPDPAAACAALAKGGLTGLVPVPDDMMCTEIYGGAQRATITGTWNGKPVQANLSRTDGCQISRWDALAGLVPAAKGSAPTPSPS